MSDKQIIRWAEAKDAGQIVRLIRALASYENEPPDSVKVTEADILRDGFGESDNTVRRFECLIAEHGRRPVGTGWGEYCWRLWPGSPWNEIAGA